MRPVSRSEQKQKLAEAYVAYRLNKHELAELLAMDGAGQDSEAKLAEYVDWQTDWRDERTPEELEKAVAALGLEEQLAELDENQVWSRFERALHRRLSDSDESSAPAPPELSGALDPLFQKQVEENFPRWDRDGSGTVENRELDHIMTGGHYGELRIDADDPERAATLAVLRRYGKRIGRADGFDSQGVSHSDFQLFLDKGMISDPTLKASVNEVFTQYLDSASSLMDPEQLADESVSPAHIFQGVPGSCVMLSTLGGMSAEELRALLEDNGDETFTIHFGDGSDEVVTEPTLAERFYHARGREDDRWVTLLERAMGQKLYQQVGEAGERSVRTAIDGIEPETALSILTGKTATKQSLDEMSLVEVREHLSSMLSGDGPVICGSRPTALGDFVSVEELHNGIVNSHAYTVKSYDPESDQVTLQNPWHKREWKHANDGVDDGVFEMPAKDFYCSFRWLASTD